MREDNALRRLIERMEEIDVLRNEAEFLRDMVLGEQGAVFRVVAPPNAVRITLSIELPPASTIALTFSIVWRACSAGSDT